MRQLTITCPNHVWVADITYLPMQRGFLYLCPILDWTSRRLFNTLTTDFCLGAVREAITQYGPPEIFNTDQGCPVHEPGMHGLLNDHRIQIGMDETERWRDNIFVERLWRSLKYEDHLNPYETVSDAQQGMWRHMTFL